MAKLILWCWMEIIKLCTQIYYTNIMYHMDNMDMGCEFWYKTIGLILNTNIIQFFFMKLVWLSFFKKSMQII